MGRSKYREGYINPGGPIWLCPQGIDMVEPTDKRPEFSKPTLPTSSLTDPALSNVVPRTDSWLRFLHLFQNKLPQEIRDIVYTHLLDNDSYPIVCVELPTPTPTSTACALPIPWTILSNLNAPLAAELTTSFYRNKIFWIREPYLGNLSSLLSRDILFGTSTIPSQHIKHLILDFGTLDAADRENVRWAGYVWHVFANARPSPKKNIRIRQRYRGMRNVHLVLFRLLKLKKEGRLRMVTIWWSLRCTEWTAKEVKVFMQAIWDGVRWLEREGLQVRMEVRRAPWDGMVWDDRPEWDGREREVVDVEDVAFWKD